MLLWKNNSVNYILGANVNTVHDLIFFKLKNSWSTFETIIYQGILHFFSSTHTHIVTRFSNKFNISNWVKTILSLIFPIIVWASAFGSVRMLQAGAKEYHHLPSGGTDLLWALAELWAWRDLGTESSRLWCGPETHSSQSPIGTGHRPLYDGQGLPTVGRQAELQYTGPRGI